MGSGQKQRISAADRFKRFVVSLFLGANLATLVLLWLCCASTWVDPEVHPRVAVVGLAFPVVLVLNLIFLPLWLVYKPRMTVVPLVGMGLCAGFILDYFPLRLRASQGRAELSVLSWNACEFAKYKADSLFISYDYLVDNEADIICLQEMDISRPKHEPLRERLDAKGMHYDHRATRSIISRLPILQLDSLPVDSRAGNGVLRADLLWGEDTLTVLSVHLESNKLSASDKDGYNDVLRTPEGDKLRSEASYLSGKIGAASSYRARQVKTILAYLDSLPQERVVLLCGDFNDTPVSYAYQAVNRRLKNAFRAQGRGVGVTFSERFFPIRIDHIFYSPVLECTEAYVDRSIHSSDHYPMVARLQKQAK